MTTLRISCFFPTQHCNICAACAETYQYFQGMGDTNPYHIGKYSQLKVNEEFTNQANELYVSGNTVNWSNIYVCIEGCVDEIHHLESLKSLGTQGG